MVRLRPGAALGAVAVVARRDRRRLAVAVAFAAGWLTWFINPDRTMFIFYMAPVVPFFVLGVTLVLGAVLGPAGASEQRRMFGARRGLRLRRARRGELGLAVADPHRPAHHVRGVAVPDLVPELDLAAHPCGWHRPGRSGYAAAAGSGG